MLAALAALPDERCRRSPRWPTRCGWRGAGPTVEVEGILSAKTGGCPEDCNFCSQSAQFDTPVQATPFLDTDEVLQAAEETGPRGHRSSASCWPCGVPTSAP